MLLIAGICRVPAHAAQPFLAYFERSLPSGQNFPKWNAIGDSLSQEIAAVEGCLGGAGCPSRAAGEIAGRLADIDGGSPLSRAEAVHDLMNSRPYRDDRRQFGRSDVWQTPFAFWRSGGDCEDYAIAKYALLKAAVVTVQPITMAMIRQRHRAMRAAKCMATAAAQHECRKPSAIEKQDRLVTVGERLADRHAQR